MFAAGLNKIDPANSPVNAAPEPVEEQPVEDTMNLSNLDSSNEDFKKEVEDIVAGILEGAVNAEGLENIEGCIKDTESVYKDVEEAVADFEKKTPDATAEGIKLLGEAIVALKDDIKECKGVVADVEKLEEMAKIFANPLTFAYHVGKDLLVNGVQIYKEIDDSITQWKSQQYFFFGEDVGDALALLILGAPDEIYEKATDESIPAEAVIPDDEPKMYLY